jgi:hypothetical protein
MSWTWASGGWIFPVFGSVKAMSMALRMECFSDLLRRAALLRRTTSILTKP